MIKNVRRNVEQRSPPSDFCVRMGGIPMHNINGELETREKRRNSDIHAYHLEGNLFGDFGRGGETFL